MKHDHPSQARLHATVVGRVQGVSFRYFVTEEAQRLALKGWVRNRYNGDVEVTAEGTRYDLEQLLQLLHEGPSMAYVTEVQAEWLPATGEFTSFWVRTTG